MLYYLWTVIQDLLCCVTMAALMHVFLQRLAGRRGLVIHRVGLCAGALAAIALAAVKQTTNKIISSHWNHWTYAVIVCLALAFFVLSLVCGRKEGTKRTGAATACAAAGSGMVAAMIFFRLPTVLLYPFSFNDMGMGFFSGYYMVRLGGWALALILLAVYACLLSACARQMRNFRILRNLVLAGALVYSMYCVGRFFVPWISRAKWLGWPVKYTEAEYGWVGSFSMWTATSAMLFIWIFAALAACLALATLLEHTKITKPWNNPAQKRKLRAENRHVRRIAAAALCFLLAFVLVLTAVKAYDTREVELSAPETYRVENDTILIAAEDVNDGHLHRFEYTTERNVTIRWIVVKKPNAASYGVGLDACEVCGNAGYYERGSQVVCKRCDVVMNINTIGFKGGCNPIPLAYEVKDGNLVFRLEDLLAGEKEFK